MTASLADVTTFERLTTEEALTKLAALVASHMISAERATDAERVIRQYNGCNAGYFTQQVQASQGVWVGNPVIPAIKGVSGRPAWFTRQQAQALVGWNVTIVTKDGMVYAGAQVDAHYLTIHGSDAGTLRLLVNGCGGHTVVDVNSLSYVHAIAPASYGPSHTYVILGGESKAI